MTIIVDQPRTPSAGIPPLHATWCDQDQHESEQAAQAAGYDEPSEAPLQPCAGIVHDTPMGAVYLTGVIGSTPTIGWLNDSRRSDLTLQEAEQTLAVLAELARQGLSLVSRIPSPTPPRGVRLGDIGRTGSEAR